MSDHAQFQFDVFLSYSSKDKEVVRPLANQLQKDGLRVWFDEWEIHPGDNIPAKIEEGLEHSRVLVLCMSANAFGADWVQLEAGTFRFRDPLNKERRFIPLRLDEAPIKGSLRQYRYINWLPNENRQEYTKLIKACRASEQRSLAQGANWSNTIIRSTAAVIFTDLLTEADTAPRTKSGAGVDREIATKELLEAAGNEYTEMLDAKHNLIRVFGMDRPIPLRNIYVRINILAEVTASRRITVSDLERDFDFDRHGFGIPHDTWEGSELVTRERYRIDENVKELIVRNLNPECRRISINRFDQVLSKTYGDTEALFSVIFDVMHCHVPQEQKEVIARLAHEPPRNYILLGKPGAGKTTFLKYLALFVLDGETPFRRIPIFITLRDYAESGLDLLEYIVCDFQQVHLPEATKIIEKAFEAGRIVALLDGLDEVSNTQQNKVIRQIARLSERFRQSQFIVSCRIAAYNHCFESFFDIEIADFSPEQISAFVFNWFQGELETARNCLGSIEERRQTMELASNPLLLTLLCIAYDESLGFPKNRAELYREAIDALLKKWDASRRIRRDELYKNLSVMRKESLMCRIASQTFERGQYFIAQRDLEKLVTGFITNLPGADTTNLTGDSEAVIKTVESQHGFLVERARGIYSFSHLTFQEYFTAKHYVENLHETINSTLITKSIDDPRWREVCLLTCGLLDQADSFFTAFKREVDKLVLNTPVSGMLSKLMEISACSIQYPDALRRCLLLIYIVYHGQAVRSVEEQKQKEFHKCLDNLCAIASAIDRGIIRRADMDRYIEYATQLAHDTEFSRHLADDPAFCLASVLKASKSRRLRRHEDRSFPIEVLEKYTTAHSLMLECLISDCYVDKRLRQRLMKGSLTIDVSYNENKKKD